MKNKKLVLPLVIISIVIISILLVLIISVNKQKNQKPFTVVEEFKITSTVQNVLLQTYKSNVTGVVKNNTDKVLKNVTLKFNVETNYFNNIGSIETEPINIDAKSEYVFELFFDTTENFEIINSITASADEIMPFHLKNETETNDTIYIFCICLLLIIGGLFSIDAIMQHKQGNNVVKNEDSAESIELENEVKGKSLKNELKERIEKDNINKFCYCCYCDSKNPIENLKCGSCGAKLK